MQQNIHLLSNSSVGFPSDIWVPAIDSVPSQTSQQWAGSVTTQFHNGQFELTLEGYYKTMQDLITYKAGYSNLESTESWDNAVETGGEGIHISLIEDMIFHLLFHINLMIIGILVLLGYMEQVMLLPFLKQYI